jgi:hypothetical protein
MTERLSGGCFCGKVRFSVAGPEKFACFCYCNSCQRAAGAPVVMWATYERSTFEIGTGDICWRESSPGVTRGHCPACGSAMTYEHERRPGEIDIAVNCLDEPAAPLPRAHIWTEDKPHWMKIADGLPVYSKNIG